MEKRLSAASKLITGLTGERTRWTADVAELQAQKINVVGNCLLAASFLSYAGAFSNKYRHEMIVENFQADVLKREIPLTQPFNTQTMLTSDATVQGWLAKGLPADEHSIQNGILTTQSSRFPLCIDPQQQAVAWIKSTYGSQLKVVVKAISHTPKPLFATVHFFCKHTLPFTCRFPCQSSTGARHQFAHLNFHHVRLSP